MVQNFKSYTWTLATFVCVVFFSSPASSDVSLTFTATTCRYSSQFGASTVLGVEETQSFGAKVNQCAANVKVFNTGFGIAKLDIAPVNERLLEGSMQAAASGDPQIGEVSSGEARINIFFNNPGIIAVEERVKQGNVKLIIDGKTETTGRFTSTFAVDQGQHTVEVSAQSNGSLDNVNNPNYTVFISAEEEKLFPTATPTPTPTATPSPIGPQARARAQSIAALIGKFSFPSKPSQNKGFKAKKAQIQTGLNDLLSLIDSGANTVSIQGTASLGKLREDIRKNLRALLGAKSSNSFKTAKGKSSASLKALIKAIQ